MQNPPHPLRRLFLTGWWRRAELGPYAPTLTRESDGTYAARNDPDPLPPHD